MLHRTYIHAIAERGARHLLERGAVAAVEPDTLVLLLERAVTEEFGAEARLREEARRLVEAQGAAVKAAGADVSTLLERVVRQLAEDRGVVLR
jgi:hypothetical protein